MKFRITPLNIVGAVSLCLAVYLFVKPASSLSGFEINKFYILLLCGLAVVTFITDMIFRFTLKDLKKIWIVEGVFIVLAVISTLILQKLA